MKREEKQYIPILAKWVEISEMENFITLRVKLQVGSDSYILKPFKQIHTNLQIHTQIRITRIYISIEGEVETSKSY